MRDGYHTERFFTREQLNLCQAKKKDGVLCENVARHVVDGVPVCGQHNRFRKTMWIRIDESVYRMLREEYPSQTPREVIEALVKTACGKNQV